jgi:protein arginine N-methyltransferase 1
MPNTYDSTGYGRMLADRVRTEAYAAALRAAVKPGSVVLDLGTGTGGFALLAARLGARRVYGVDPTDLVAVAREVARANGLADRVEFVQALSSDLHPPERADVIVFDLRGVLPPFQRIVETVVDARERLLAPGGVLIPHADTLLAAPVHAPDAWNDIVGPAEVFELDFSAARRPGMNSWMRRPTTRDQLVAAPAAWAAIDYRTVASPDLRGTAAWTVERAGPGHGLALWFRTDLGEGIGFESGPDSGTIYQTGFFPWPRPVELAPGDRVEADLQARLVSGEYLWFWDTRIHPAAGEPLSFRQSTFFALPPSPDRLRRRADSFVPTLAEEGRIEAFVLARIDGATPLGEIARALADAFPERFPTWEAALGRVGTLSERYAG